MNLYFLPVLALILLIWVIFFSVYVYAARRDGRAPADDIGVMFLLVLALYTTLPSLFWLIQGGEYSSMLASRLMRLKPDIGEVLYLLFIALAYAVGFSVIYLWWYRRIRPPAPGFSSVYINDSKFAGAVVVLVVNAVIGLFISFSGMVRTSESYIDQYRVIQELPLVLRQLVKIVGGIGVVAQLIVLIALLQRWPRYRGWFFLYLFSILFSFDADGSRSVVVIGILSVLVAWHVLVRPIPTARWFAIFCLGLSIFLILGIFRNIGDWTTLWALVGPDLFTLGELDSLWANAIELLQSSKTGPLNIPTAALVNEFISFVPSQILPFQKATLADWYLDEYYYNYKLQGGGFAFGAVAQAVVGGGLIEAFVRGAFLGGISIWVMRWYRAPKGAWWRLPMYLYLFVFSFQSVRSSTFSQLSDVIQIFIPAIILITILSQLFLWNKKS